MFRGDDPSGLDPYKLQINGTDLFFHIENNSGQVAELTAPLSSYLGRWTHVAATVDDTTGKVSLYINGTLASSITTRVRPLGASPFPLATLTSPTQPR